jgi:hypothetical protein
MAKKIGSYSIIKTTFPPGSWDFTILHMPVFVKCLPFSGSDLTVQAVWWEERRCGGHGFSEGADMNNRIDEPMKEENEV